MYLNIGCGEHTAPAPWVNIDTLASYEPDYVVTPHPDKWPDALSRIEYAYCGHVLEHMPWHKSIAFMHALRHRMRSTGKPSGGKVMVVQPDLFRVLAAEDHQLLLMTMEDDLHYQPADDDWDQARHHWNSYEARVVRLLEAAGWSDVTPLPVGEVPAMWPVVSRVGWQCAVEATA